MSIALLVITDGRLSYLEETITSAEQHLQGPITEHWMFDDTGDKEHRTLLGEMYPTFQHINAGPRQGFGGAIRSAWDHLSAHSSASYVFHLEQDFTFNRDVPLVDMARILEMHPHLVQMALRRQPWNDQERAAGGIVEQHPADFTQVNWTGDVSGCWLEHRRFFTTNPSLYRMALCHRGWPKAQHSEGVFTHQLLADPAVRFGYWGAFHSGEWVTHIGHERAGVGY